MLKKWIIASLGCCMSWSVLAGAMGDENEQTSVTDYHPWSIVGSIGYTAYQNVTSGSGGSPLGRLGIAKEFFNSGDTGSMRGDGVVDSASLHMGLELAVQSGLRVSVPASQEVLNGLGGLPPLVTSKPMLDLLATLTYAPMSDVPAFLISKGGIAYRQWQADYNSVENVSKIAGEFQVGLGVAVAEAATLSLLYQGVYGTNPNLTVNSTTGTAQIAGIPTQSGILLSMSLIL